MGSPIDAHEPDPDRDDVADAKRAVRRRMRPVRRAVADREERSARLWAQVVALSSVRAAEVVMVFDSIPGEPDTTSFIVWCREAGKTVVIPAADPAAPFPAEIDRIDVVIVPGVAFTPVGDRLGQGGGWYDRLLALVRPDCVSIGVCFVEQIVDRLPTGVHDRRVDLVVGDRPSD